MTYFIARRKFRYQGQTEWRMRCLRGVYLAQFRSILEIVEMLSFADLRAAATAPCAIRALGANLRLAVVAPSSRFPNIHLTVFSDILSVGFIITEGASEITITRIDIDDDPSGGGPAPQVPLPQSPDSVSSRKGRQMNNGAEKIKALLSILAIGCLRWPVRLAKLNLRQGLHAKSNIRTLSALLSMSYQTQRIRQSSTKVVSPVIRNMNALANLLDKVGVVQPKDYRLGRLQLMLHDRPCRQGREALVQVGQIGVLNGDVKLSSGGITIAGLDQSTDLGRILRTSYARAILETSRAAEMESKIFFFGAFCPTARDRDTFAISFSGDDGRVRIFVHSNALSLKQRNSVDLVLGAAINDLIGDEHSSIHIQCDGNIPFTEESGSNPLKSLIAWQQVFKTKRICVSGPDYFCRSGSNLEFVLNDEAQTAIKDYYSLACARFEAGMSRDDAFIWRELAHRMCSEQIHAELAIVFKEAQSTASKDDENADLKD